MFLCRYIVIGTQGRVDRKYILVQFQSVPTVSQAIGARHL